MGVGGGDREFCVFECLSISPSLCVLCVCVCVAISLLSPSLCVFACMRLFVSLCVCERGEGGADYYNLRFLVIEQRCCDQLSLLPSQVPRPPQLRLLPLLLVPLPHQVCVRAGGGWWQRQRVCVFECLSISPSLCVLCVCVHDYLSSLSLSLSLSLCVYETISLPLCVSAGEEGARGLL